MVFSIQMTEEEKILVDSYAEFHGISLEEAFQRVLFEKIEDEYDIAMGKEAYKEYVQESKKSRPIEELWKELDI
ncbi:type II toxin-antitoxin system RelB family antitoxin [Mediterraneibacter gnavus]|uniref:type II toxin-antitoxin system RelB family antitoxin n=1 Tax=Mediterraneibacter gnavus TaxID=33038 RepID=UPI0032B77A0F